MTLPKRPDTLESRLLIPTVTLQVTRSRAAPRRWSLLFQLWSAGDVSAPWEPTGAADSPPPLKVC